MDHASASMGGFTNEAMSAVGGKKEKKKKLRVQEFFGEPQDASSIKAGSVDEDDDDDVDSVIQVQSKKLNVQRSQSRADVESIGPTDNKSMIRANSKTNVTLDSGIQDNRNRVLRGAGRQTHQTIDPDESNAQSVADNVSAGGTRYIVGVKGLKFYGNQDNSANDESGSVARPIEDSVIDN